MNIHENAGTTPYSRAEIVWRVMLLHETRKAVATALGVSERTVAKWLALSAVGIIPISPRILQERLRLVR